MFAVIPIRFIGTTTPVEPENSFNPAPFSGILRIISLY